MAEDNSDLTPDPDEEEEEDFAQLFEAYSQGMNENIQTGDRIEGTIIAIGKDSVFVDTGTKIDGAVSRGELLDENGELQYGEGDTVELYVVSISESEIGLSRALSGIGGLHLLQEAHDNALPVEGKVQATCKGGFKVEMMQRRAFCPISQIDLAYVENADEHVGQTYNFLVTRLEDRGRNIVISRRKLLEKEQEKVVRAFLENTGAGAQIEGRVSRLMPYGAFIELVPGLEGLAHVSELTWSRVEHPGQVFQPGDPVRAKILTIDQPEGARTPKIALSVKQTMDDPWQSAHEHFKAGDKVKGRVTRCVKFGVFVEIAPGIEGLVHISEMSYKKRVHHPEDVVAPGDEVYLMIKDLDTARRRISLSLKDAEGDPWAEVNQKYKVGQQVQGSVERKEGFGYFITLEPGITGLMPRSKISQSPSASTIDKLKAGDTVAVLVEEIQPQARRMTLAPADGADSGNWREFAADDQTAMSPLAEKLKRALAGKK